MNKQKTLEVLEQLNAFVYSLPDGTPDVKISAYKGAISAKVIDADNIEYTFDVRWPIKDGEA